MDIYSGGITAKREEELKDLYKEVCYKMVKECADLFAQKTKKADEKLYEINEFHREVMWPAGPAEGAKALTEMAATIRRHQAMEFISHVFLLLRNGEYPFTEITKYIYGNTKFIAAQDYAEKIGDDSLKDYVMDCVGTRFTVHLFPVRG